jgi:hypothetical protein
MRRIIALGEALQWCGCGSHLVVGLGVRARARMRARARARVRARVRAKRCGLREPLVGAVVPLRRLRHQRVVRARPGHLEHLHARRRGAGGLRGGALE